MSASAREENHKTLLKAGFYTLFKRNINHESSVIRGCTADTELYGLVNLALNVKYLPLIWKDLRKIYKLVFKRREEEITFTTKVDLFSSCAKFIALKSSQTEI